MDEELKKLIESSAAETRRHFDVVAEGLQSKIEAVAEGVLSCNERIDRLEERMKEEFANTRAMIRFSHHELDRRVQALETAVADMQARLERLESSTH